MHVAAMQEMERTDVPDGSTAHTYIIMTISGEKIYLSIQLKMTN